MEEKSKEKKPRPYKSFIRFSGIAFQMGVTIYLGSALGEYLDDRNANPEGFYMKFCTLGAVFLAIISVIFQVTRYQR